MASSSLLKALVTALEVLPPQAVPATVDSLLFATSTPPLVLFSSLVDYISELTKELLISDVFTEQKGDFFIAILMAMLHLFKAADDNDRVVPIGVWIVLVPLLQRSNPSWTTFQNIVSQVLAEMFSCKMAWNYAKNFFLSYLSKSVELVLSRERKCNLESLQTRLEEDVFLDASDEDWHHFNKPLTLFAICRIMAALLSKATSDMDMKHAQDKDRCESLEGSFCLEVISRIFQPMVSVMSCTSSDADRQCVIKVFLPPALKVILKMKEIMDVRHVELLQREIWENLEILFSHGCLQRQDAFSALDTAIDFLLFSHVRESDCGADFDICCEMQFWDVVKSGLVGDDPLTRKRALHILKEASKAGSWCHSMPDGLVDWKGLRSKGSGSLTKRDNYAASEARSLGLWNYEMEGWKAFFLLYDMLEEYGTHLVEAAWNHQISVLLPTLCGEDYSGLEASNESQSKGKHHLQGLDARIFWVVVLWERGFKHDNPQVRRLILQSLMGLNWGKIPNLALVVPESFLLGPLLLALNDPVHHNDFGVKGIYTSDMAKAVAKFYSLYSISLEARERSNFVTRMAGALSVKPLSRPGFMASVMCLEAASSPHHVLLDDGKFQISDCYGSMHLNTGSEAMEVLDCVGLLVEESKNHFNPKYRLKVCDHLLRAASSLVALQDLPFSKMFWFLGLFPPDFVNHKGILHKHVRKWLTSASIEMNSVPFDFQTWMTEGLHDIADAFLRPLVGRVDDVTDEEVEVWTQKADKWARVVSLGFLDSKNLSRLMMFVHDCAGQIYKRAYNTTCISEKLLLLLASIIRVCSCPLRDNVELKRSRSSLQNAEEHGSLVSLTTEIGCSLAVISNHLHSIIDMNMDELIAHARRMSSIFLNYDPSGSFALPGSVTGKLGGPSQRRLPATVASDVLKGIIAVATVADCISWSCETNGNISDSAVLFIWEFVWKLATLKEAMQEMEGEIQLSLYEALIPLSKALAMTVNWNVLSLVNQSVIFSGERDGRVLDILVWNFLENVNCLLHGRVLARSRRAVLSVHKWCCLDGLLSIPQSRVRNVNSKELCRVSAFSNSVLKTILLDAISSLESAGDDNMIPLLRCVRWLIHWGILHSLDGVDAHDDERKGLEVVWSLVRAAWAAVADSKKRRVVSIAAFLSAIIHPNVFQESAMHYNNGEPGPLKWLIGKLLDQGARSPRTMRLTAMHVAGLWLKYPATTEYYIEEIKLLSLHGGESIDEELDGQICENPQAAREYLMLMQSLDPELIEKFRNSELYVRITVSVLVHKLAEIFENATSSTDLEAISASTFGKKLILRLLKALAYDKELSKELYKKKSAIHRRKIRAWQITCIMLRFVDKEMFLEVMDLLQSCLLKNNLPSVRQYAEIFGVLLCLRFPQLVKERLLPPLYDYNMKTQALASYVFISVNVLIHATPDVQKDLLEQVVPAVIPYFTTHHHPLRSFSQILMYEVLHKMVPDCDNLEENRLASLGSKCLHSILSYLEGNTDCVRIRTAVEKFLRSFDPSTASTPRGIFSIQNGGEEDPSKPLDDTPFECAPIALMDSVSLFLNEARKDLRQSMAADALSIYSDEMLDHKPRSAHLTENYEATLLGPSRGPRVPVNGSIDFQRKIGSLRFSETPSSELLASLSAMEREEELLLSTIHTRIEDLGKMRGNRQELIVVATLLGRIPNLAGLVRTCEVFKASTLVLADAAVTQDRQFQLISVTAEMWVPIKEVPEVNLHEYLAAKIEEGFTLVGLEQTSNSISLQKFEFPKKTVLVLGREKEGIPIDIIQSLDACVEIPQLGVIRSLNVHVSGAIAIWEYTRRFLS